MVISGGRSRATLLRMALIVVAECRGDGLLKRLGPASTTIALLIASAISGVMAIVSPNRDAPAFASALRVALASAIAETVRLCWFTVYGA